MGASRLYLGDHWLTDVLASYALAVAVLAAVAWAAARYGQAWDSWTTPLLRRLPGSNHTPG
jgi:undecaprenyl-diphosphatase